MPGSIFSRLMATYLVLAILVASVLAVAAASIYQKAVFDEKRRSLQDVARRTAMLAADHFNGVESIETLKAAVNAYGFGSDAMIYVVRLDSGRLLNESLAEAGLDDAFVGDSIAAIQRGETVYLEKKHSDVFGMSVLFAGQPVINGSVVKGAVLVFCPVRDVDKIAVRLQKAILLAAALVILAVSPLIFLNARRLSRPIRELEATARRIAGLGNRQGKPGNSRDEIALLAEAFREMQEQLEEVERTRIGLIADLSHELRTPLTSVSGFVQALQDGVGDDDERRQYLQIIRDETDRLVRLTSELLELARIQSGNITLKMEALALEEAVRAAESAMAVLSAAKMVTVKHEIDHGMIVRADREKLHRILVNLLSNSIRHSPEGGIVTIRAWRENDRAVVSVRDIGEGIPEKDLPYIFDKFWRSGAGAGDEKRTGLGLPIVRHLVELQGGTVTADSLSGTGTTITFTIRQDSPGA